jgi:hypothetical protein
MKTKTYYRTIGYLLFKLIVSTDNIEVYERQGGKWTDSNLVVFGFYALQSPLAPSLEDGSFFANIRKGL